MSEKYKNFWNKYLAEKDLVKKVNVEVQIVEDRCKGCMFCVEFCPNEVLEKSTTVNIKGFFPPKIKDLSKCSNCGFCTLVCPDFAIWIVEKK